jgi:hypothetical protein
MMLPETGASTISAPFSLTFAATARLTSGLTVLMSMTTLPAESPASRPSGPLVTASSEAEFVTITKMKSAAWQTAFGDPANVIPFSTSQSAFDLVRLYPVTL